MREKVVQKEVEETVAQVWMPGVGLLVIKSFLPEG